MRYRLALVVCFLSSALFAQEFKKEYHLKGLGDSLSYPVTIEQDLPNEVTHFRLQGYTLDIFGVQDIKSIVLHSNAFLEVQFRIRAGSGVRIRRTVLLCVSEDRIYRSLDVLTEVTSRLNKVYNKMADSLKLFDEKEDYHVKLSVNQVEGSNYQTELTESKRIESKYNPSQNISFEKSYKLRFDHSGYFFYNSMQRLNKRYKIYSLRDNSMVEKFISAEVPCVQFYDGRYLYIDNEWCVDNGQGTLSCR